MAASAHHSEINYNPVLSELLDFRLPRWNVTSQVTGVLRAAQKQPDVFLEHPSGVPMVIECKYDLGATKRKDVESDAQLKLGHIVAKTGLELEQAVAVLYPEHLRTTTKTLKDSLENSLLQFAVYSSSEDGIARFPNSGWLEGNVNALSNFVELVSVSEQRINDALDDFVNGVNAGAGRLNIAKGSAAEISNILHQEPGEQTLRMGVAIMLNALVFQSTVAENYKEIDSITQLMHKSKKGELSQVNVLSTWRKILEIDYWPIFAIASDVLAAIPSEAAAKSMLNALAVVADSLTSVSSHTVQDLSGQVFGKLISDKKFLGTFYTLPESATLLAELAVRHLDADLSDKDSVKNLRIADLACGTGALLSAIYRKIAASVRANGIDDVELHRDMLENVLIGADIMPAAVHITASMLSSVHPNEEYTNTCTHVMPYGEQINNNVAIGSLELITQNKIRTLWGDGSLAVTPSGEDSSSELNMPHLSCDIIIMNPPFPRSTKHAAEAAGIPIPIFAGFNTKEEEQRKMSQKLKTLIAGRSHVGEGNAGLASYFFDLAHAKLKYGGVLALVLPAVFCAGSSWKKARNLLDKEYKDITIISLATFGSTLRAFSADTGMADVLVIATKKEKYEISEGTEKWTWINLNSRPSTHIESSAIAEKICSSRNHLSKIIVGKSSYGYIALGSKNSNYSQIMKSELIELGEALRSSKSLYIPEVDQKISFPLCKLGDLGIRGTYHLDIKGKIKRRNSNEPRGPFEIVKVSSESVERHYPAHLGHEFSRETRLLIHPMGEAVIIQGMEEKAKSVWQTSTRLQFNQDFTFTSLSMAACITPKKTIGTSSWLNFKLCETPDSQERMDWVYPVLLWANSTIGLVSFWFTGTRQQQTRSRISLTRLSELPVIDPRQLDKSQLKKAELIYKNFYNRDFLPANEAYRDVARKELDEAIFRQLLRYERHESDILSWLDVVRDQWCREPTVHGGQSSRPDGNSNVFLIKSHCLISGKIGDTVLLLAWGDDAIGVTTSNLISETGNSIARKGEALCDALLPLGPLPNNTKTTPHKMKMTSNVAEISISAGTLLVRHELS